MKKLLILTLIMCTMSSFLALAQDQKKELTLKEAIYYALKNNLDLQIQMTDSEIAVQTLKAAKAIFIPRFTITGYSAKNKQEGTSTLSGGQIITQTTSGLDVALQGKIPYGGNLTLSFNNSKTTNSNIYSLFNPLYNSQGQFVFEQPLLKNFGLTPTKSQIYIAANNEKISKFQLQENIMTLVLNVENAYWNLVFAHQQLEASKMALQRSQDLLKQNEIKVKVGSAAPIEILTAKAAVAGNESTIIQSEIAIQTAEENLKRILNMSTQDITLFPADSPEVKNFEGDFKSLLEEGFKNRPDLEKAKIEIENQNINLKVAKNQVLPALNFNFTFFSPGVGGKVYTNLVNPMDPSYDPIKHRILVSDRSLGDAIKDVLKRTYKNYQVNLTLNIPISFAAEKAQLAQAKINQKRTSLNYQNIENTFKSQLKEALKELEASTKLVEAQKIALQLQEEKLKAEEKKLAVGLSTNSWVLDFQQQLSQAQTQALQSVINYELTIAKLNKILARTFSVYDIKLADYIK